MSEMTRRTFLFVGAATCACALCPLSDALGADASAPVNVGAATEITEGISDRFAKSDKFFLVRDGNRIYAPSAVCSHKRAPLTTSAGGFKCAKHGSSFAKSGEVTKGPAKTALPRLAIRIDDQGHVIVDPTKHFEESQWNDPGSFVKVK